MLSKDNISTGLGDIKYFSNIVLGWKPERSRILSSGRKLINDSCLGFSVILPIVEKVG